MMHARFVTCTVTIRDICTFQLAVPAAAVSTTFVLHLCASHGHTSPLCDERRVKHNVSRSTLSQFHQTQHTLVRRDIFGECSWLCRR